MQTNNSLSLAHTHTHKHTHTQKVKDLQDKLKDSDGSQQAAEDADARLIEKVSDHHWWSNSQLLGRPTQLLSIVVTVVLLCTICNLVPSLPLF